MMRRTMSLVSVLSLALLAPGCSQVTAGSRQTGRTVGPAGDSVEPPREADPPTLPAPAASSAPVLDAGLEPPLPERLPDEDLEGPDQPPTTRGAFERALEWAEDGVRRYLEGDHEGAHRLLDEARIALLDADLPEAFQEQGLGVLSCALASDLGQHDLEAIAQELEVELQLARDASELEERDAIEHEVRKILRRFGASMPRDAYLEIFVDEVARYIDYYRDKGREFFERSFERKHKYWPTIEAVFAARNIPSELGYMALVESGFNPRARSRANARGLWQFIPGTGKRYGLRRTDDFYDVQKATVAASEYLLDLIGIFGSPSFLLATAAYNAGEGRIQGCLRKLDDPFDGRSFWEIRECLARETREYVPRIMAAVVIGTDPGRFGFDLATEEEMGERYDVVTIPSITRLSQVAREAGVSVADLRTANSDLASTATTTPARNFPIYIPSGGGVRLAESLRASPASPAPASPAPASPAPAASSASSGSRSSLPRGAAVEYVARAGDTLSEIAEDHGVRVADLKQWNPHLNRRWLYRGDRLTIHPGSGGSGRSTYRVQRGDTLSTIAERLGVPYRDLAGWNSLRSPYRLSIGQALVVYGAAAPRRLTYTVKRGNTLRAIADVFSVRYRDIMAWNDLKRSTVRVGQELVIEPPRPVRRESYQVRRGDTVAKIARRFGVPVRDVLTANGLGSRTLIRPGQRLVVYVV